ncbi:MAG: AI-2E family transporter [Solirubrobacterales bacterium]|nr:AI-2E family transporter [Solirubrobacterales bacterium]
MPPSEPDPAVDISPLKSPSSGVSGGDLLPARTVVKTVLIVFTIIATIVVLYLLRQPLEWIFIAGFIAVAVSGPINLLERRMPRPIAITIVYLALVLTPFGLAAVLVPPIVSQATELANNAPKYARDIQNFVNTNTELRKLEEKYNITKKLEDEAAKLPDQLPNAAATLRDLGLGVVSSIFAAVTILLLSIFMVASGRGWVTAFLRTRPPDHADRLERTINRIGNAVGNFVAGALVQAIIAGVTTFIILSILGVPFAGPLAVLVAFFDLLPLVGATIAAILVAIVTLFNDFPVDTIIWIVWAVVYQQIENSVIQPQIHKRAVDVQPFIVLVSVLFGATLFGIIGALLAIPIAASIQIAVSEYRAYRRETQALDDGLAVSINPPG